MFVCRLLCLCVFQLSMMCYDLNDCVVLCCVRVSLLLQVVCMCVFVCLWYVNTKHMCVQCICVLCVRVFGGTVFDLCAGVFGCCVCLVGVYYVRVYVFSFCLHMFNTIVYVCIY